MRRHQHPILRITAVIGVLSLILVGQTSSQSPQETGKVSGTVMDISGAIIDAPFAVIQFEGEQQTIRVRPDKSGNYRVELKPGVYEITADINGFYPFRRAGFRLHPGRSVVINIVPDQRFLFLGTAVPSTANVNVAAPTPKYEAFHTFSQEASLPSIPLVKFKERAKVGSMIEYRSATLTYDLTTVYASRITFDKTKRKFEASGWDTIVEDGERRVKVRSVEIIFEGNRPSIKIIN